MRLREVLDSPEFDIDLVVSGPSNSLDRVFTWSIPLESMDPTAFLSPNSLLLTSGITLNITDYRAWDAYVERLAKVPITALVFALGLAHKELPDGLVAACENYDLPLLSIPAHIPFAMVQRSVQDQITSERYDLVRRGSELAQKCTELVAQGGTLQDLLHVIATQLGRRVALEDRTGMELLRAGDPGTITAREEFRIPGPIEGSFRLVVETINSAPTVATVIRPATAVLALQLNMTLGSASATFSRHAGQLVDAIYNTHSIPTEELLALARDAELDAFAPIGIVLIEVEPGLPITYLRTVSWRVRTRLASEFSRMRFVDDLSVSTLLTQGTNLNKHRLKKIVESAVGTFSGIHCVLDVVENSAELGLALRHIRRKLGQPGVQCAPQMDFDAVVDTLQHPGTESMSRRLLQPLEDDTSGVLRETLESYLLHSGRTPQICEELFIHRNTLSHRLQRLEELLEMDLQSGQARATLLLALRLTTSPRA